MENIIDFNNAVTTSINNRYDGTYKDETGDYEYVVFANHNEWDDWTIDDIQWIGETPENQEEVESIINDEFNKTMYGE
jgi:hypothetical protein